MSDSANKRIRSSLRRYRAPNNQPQGRSSPREPTDAPAVPGALAAPATNDATDALATDALATAAAAVTLTPFELFKLHGGPGLTSDQAADYENLTVDTLGSAIIEWDKTRLPLFYNNNITNAANKYPDLTKASSNKNSIFLDNIKKIQLEARTALRNEKNNTNLRVSFHDIILWWGNVYRDQPLKDTKKDIRAYVEDYIRYYNRQEEEHTSDEKEEEEGEEKEEEESDDNYDDTHDNESKQFHSSDNIPLPRIFFLNAIFIVS